MTQQLPAILANQLLRAGDNSGGSAQPQSPAKQKGRQAPSAGSLPAR
jgi:hypothetical protein